MSNFLCADSRQSAPKNCKGRTCRRGDDDTPCRLASEQVSVHGQLLCACVHFWCICVRALCVYLDCSELGVFANIFHHVLDPSLKHCLIPGLQPSLLFLCQTNSKRRQDAQSQLRKFVKCGVCKCKSTRTRLQGRFFVVQRGETNAREHTLTLTLTLPRTRTHTPFFSD